MGKLVKLLGSGVGLAAEAIQHQREKSKEKSSQAGSSSGTPSSTSLPISPQPSTSRSPSGHGAGRDAPPAYVELPDDRADELIRGGKAVPVSPGDTKGGHVSKAKEAGYDDESSDDDEPDEAHELAEDEAAWELDEMAERVAPPSYEQSEADLEAEASASLGSPKR